MFANIYCNYYNKYSDNTELYGYVSHFLKTLFYPSYFVPNFLSPIVCWICQQGNELITLRDYLSTEFTLKE